MMTVGELLEVTPELVEVQITIRENGRYIYRYFIGEHIRVPQGYTEFKYEPEIGEKFESKEQGLYPFPAMFWAVSPHKASKDIKNLEISDIKFATGAFMSWKYKENNISWQSKAFITCYPIGWTKPSETKANIKEDAIEGQMDITEFID